MCYIKSKFWPLYWPEEKSWEKKKDSSHSGTKQLETRKCLLKTRAKRKPSRAYPSIPGQEFLKLLPLLVKAVFNTRKGTLPKRGDLISNSRTQNWCCMRSSVALSPVLTKESLGCSWEIWMREGPDNNTEYYKVAAVLK